MNEHINYWVISGFLKEEKITFGARERAINILNAVCQYFKVEPEAITGPSQTDAACDMRRIYIYLLRKRTDLTLKQVGALVNRECHTTILCAFRKCQEYIKNRDERTLKAYNKIIQLI